MNYPLILSGYLYNNSVLISLAERGAMMAEGRFELRPVGPYSLAASVRFLEGFAPAAYEGHEEGHLHLAFVADGARTWLGYASVRRGV
jgi:hypothetical protein